jgi:hypothetical protein
VSGGPQVAAGDCSYDVVYGHSLLSCPAPSRAFFSVEICKNELLPPSGIALRGQQNEISTFYSFAFFAFSFLTSFVLYCVLVVNKASSHLVFLFGSFSRAIRVFYKKMARPSSSRIKMDSLVLYHCIVAFSPQFPSPKKSSAGLQRKRKKEEGKFVLTTSVHSIFTPHFRFLHSDIDLHFPTGQPTCQAYSMMQPSGLGRA